LLVQLVTVPVEDLDEGEGKEVRLPARQCKAASVGMLIDEYSVRQSLRRFL